MRFTNFTSSCLGKAFIVLLCILLGVVLTLGAIIGGGYIVLIRKGMVGTVQDFLNKQGLEMSFDDELRSLSLLEWGKELLPAFTSLSSTPLGKLDELLGIEFLSAQMASLTGLDIDIVKETTLENFGETLSENMTVINATEKFGVQLPDLPAFHDESFLNSPLSTAFSQINDFAISDFVEVDENSSPVLQSIATLKIGQLSDSEEGLDKRINSLPLKDVITIVEEGENKSSAVLIRLKDTPVGELGSSQTNDLIMSMTLQEIIELEEGVASPILWELRDTQINELGSSQTDDRIKNMKISELIDIDSNSSNILQYFAENEVTLAGTDEFGNPNGVNHAMKVMTLKDMIPLTEGVSVKLLWALRDCPLQTIPADGENDEILGLEDQLKITPLSQLLEVSNSYIWQYLGAATVVNIGSFVDDMKISDAIEITEFSPPILRKMRQAKDGEDATLFGSEDIRIDELDTKLEPLILDLELGEILSIDSTSEPILIALKDVKIENMNTAISQLTIAQVFTQDVYSDGALALIPSDTLIVNTSTKIKEAAADARLQCLINVGMVDDDSIIGITDEEIQAKLRNNTIDGIFSGYTQILNAISNSQLPLLNNFRPDRVRLDSTLCPNEVDTIDMDFINQLLSSNEFKEGDTLVLEKNMTIAADNFYVLFNVMTNGYTLEIESGATIRSATYNPVTNEYTNDKGGYIILSNETYAGGIGINDGGTIIGAFSNPDNISIPGEIVIQYLAN